MIEVGIIRERLKAALDFRCRERGVTPGQVAGEARCRTQRGWDAAYARALPAEAHLALCELLDLDPATCLPAPNEMPPRRGLICWALVGASVQGRMTVDAMTTRSVAKAAGVSAATIVRAAAGRKIGAGSFLALAGWCRRHPHEWTLGMFHDEQPVKRAASHRSGCGCTPTSEPHQPQSHQAGEAA